MPNVFDDLEPSIMDRFWRHHATFSADEASVAADHGVADLPPLDILGLIRSPERTRSVAARNVLRSVLARGVADLAERDWAGDVEHVACWA